MKMNKRVYGVVGIKSMMSNWNADFSGKPKTTSNGDIFGSDKAFKYPIKKMWESQGKPVLYVKSYSYKEDKNNKTTFQARTLSQRFEQKFNKKISDISDKAEIIKSLFAAIDVLNFGATFAEEKNNISITGAVQVGQGFNKYDDSNVEVIDILSPFVDSTKDDAQNTSIGKKIVSNEAHYMYPFSVNPENYDIYTQEIKVLEGYTQEAYESFKEGCLVAATAHNTNSKAGCENEFAIFVECNENSKLYLANLDQYIEFIKKEKGKDIIDLSKLSDILSQDNIKNEISNIEVYYNQYTIELKGVLPQYNINNLI